MKQELNLKTLDLTPMSTIELQNTNGGGFWDTLVHGIGYGIGYLAHAVVDDVKGAFNGTYQQSSGSQTQQMALN